MLRLLNIALDGMEGAAGVRYLSAASNAGYLEKDSPALVRYADDFVVLCHSREEAVAAKARLAAWLAQRGLGFNEDKTSIVHLDEGFDFLGFHVQRRKDKLLHGPVLRQVQTRASEPPLGLWRPQERRLHGAVQLDPHRPAPLGQGRVLT